MIKTPEELSDEFKKDADILKKKSNEFKEFIAVAPNAIRIMDAYADMLYYTSDELNKFSQFNPESQDYPDYKGSDYYKIQSIEGLKVPSKSEVFSIGTSVSGLLTDATSSVMYKVTTYPGYENNYFGNIPTQYSQLRFTDDLCNLLRRIESKHAETWRSAWEQLVLEREDSIKNAAVNARTVFDSISWIPNFDHLKSLAWCELDDKDRPTRTTRYAWIRYGDVLPDSLNKDPNNDPDWRSLKESYDCLQKFVHVNKFSREDKQILETALKAIEIALIGYLELGIERVKSEK